MTQEFSGRVALITGGSRGIGRATALLLGRLGCNVAISYVSRVEEAEQVVGQLHDMGRKAIAVACDVSQRPEVETLVSATRRDVGPIDFLVHSGAISTICDHTGLTPDLWQRMMDVNLTGTYNIVFAVKDEMIGRKFGRIVTLSSNAALGPRHMQIHYSTAKAGVIAFTRCCAEAFAPHNIRVNCLAPGLTETEMAHVLSDETISSIIARTPLGRVGQPEEMAATIRFLLSEDSGFMTGQVLVASGGRDMLQ